MKEKKIEAIITEVSAEAEAPPFKFSSSPLTEPNSFFSIEFRHGALL